MNPEPSASPKSPFKNPFLYSSLLIFAVILYVSYVLYARYQSSREYERQADIEGAQIMARAGYDPRDMANMFKTIEKQGGPGGPQWLSDHEVRVGQ